MYIENTKTLKVLCAKFEAQLDQMNQTSHLGYYRGDKKKLKKKLFDINT